MNFPETEGVYQFRELDGEEWREIEVYMHPARGLCVWTSDYGAEPDPTTPDDIAGHVSVQFTGLEFGEKLRELN